MKIKRKLKDVFQSFYFAFDAKFIKVFLSELNHDHNGFENKYILYKIPVSCFNSTFLWFLHFQCRQIAQCFHTIDLVRPNIYNFLLI